MKTEGLDRRRVIMSSVREKRAKREKKRKIAKRKARVKFRVSAL